MKDTIDLVFRGPCDDLGELRKGHSDVRVDKRGAPARKRAFEIAHESRGEVIDDNDVLAVAHERFAEVAAEEAGAAGHKVGHLRSHARGVERLRARRKIRG